MIGLKKPAPLLLLALFGLSTAAHAAAPFELDLKELDRQSAAPPAKPEKKKPAKEKKSPAKHAKPSRTSRTETAGGEYVRYTVKPGDHIFKILMSRFGMSNEAAERLIPEIVRVNNIGNIRKLTVGQTLLIPRKGKVEAKACPPEARPRRTAKRSEAAASESAPRQEREAKSAAPVLAPQPQQVPAPVPESPARAPEALAPEAPVPEVPSPEAALHAAEAAAPPAAEAAPAAPAAPVQLSGATWTCSVAGADAAGKVDSVLNALSIPWKKNRIIDSEPGAASTFSIRVDRYFEFRGGKYIVSIEETDPYSYTLIRLLETAGYKTATVSRGEDFKEVTEKLLNLVGISPEFGKFVVQGKERNGFLVRQEDAAGRQVLISDEPADPGQKWVMKPGCR